MSISETEVELLKLLSRKGLIDAIIERRTDIRKHRDARGDDRCFLDDYLVWRWFVGPPTDPTEFISVEHGMAQCILFYEYRNADEADQVPEDAILEPAHWDDDLAALDDKGLFFALSDIQQAIRKHRDITGRPRMTCDDRELYHVLPEKLPADFRLPSRGEFLGTVLFPHAGCPAFWNSHGQCQTKTHNFHAWGPCKPAH